MVATIQNNGFATINSNATPNVALTQYVADTTAAIDKADAGLPAAAPVTPSTSKRVLRPRKGAQAVMPQLASLLAQHGLDGPAIPVATMSACLQDAQTLGPLLVLVEDYARQLQSVIASKEGASWKIALHGYAALQRLSRDDETLAAALEPIAKFFAYRHPSTRAGQPTKPEKRATRKLRNAADAVATRAERATKAAEDAKAALAEVGQSAGETPAGGHPAATSATPAGGTSTAHG
jgi:hypothetical protein